MPTKTAGYLPATASCRVPDLPAQPSYNPAGNQSCMKKILTFAGMLLLCMALALVAGCTQPETPVATPVPTPEPTAGTVVATPEPTTVSMTPGPTQTLPDMWSLDVQVNGNNYGPDPQVIATIRGGKGLNFILAVDVQVTRADGKVETGSIKRDGTFRVGDSVSLPVTNDMGNVNRVVVWATDPQGQKVKIHDALVPYRSFN